VTAIREQILAGIFARLQALAAERDAVDVYRDRGFAMSMPNQRAISLEDGGDISADDTRCLGCTFKTMDVVVQLRAVADDPDDIGTAINDLYSRVSAIVLGDYSQGGLAIDTHDGGQSVLDKPVDENLPNLGAAEARFSVDYQHATGRPDLLF
jgi:hypothetical protein